MSIVAGPPESQIWITPVAGLPRGSGGIAGGLGPEHVGKRQAQAAPRRRPSGSRGGETPRSRSVFATWRQPPIDGQFSG